MLLFVTEMEIRQHVFGTESSTTDLPATAPITAFSGSFNSRFACTKKIIETNLLKVEED